MCKVHKTLIVFFLVSIFTGCGLNNSAGNTPIPDDPTPSLALTRTPTVMPTLKPTLTTIPSPTTDACMLEDGVVVRTLFRSEILKFPYEVSIYTPPCYGSKAQTIYPVLYLLHGQNADDSFWLSLGVADLADDLIRAGAPPFMMVMPREVKNFDPAAESGFGTSLMTELIPWVESNYDVCTSRDCRAIGGISRGGGWAVRLSMRNFDTFGAVGAHSMGLMPGDWWQAQNNLQSYSLDEYPRIYIDRGEDDFLRVDIDYFEKVLTRNAIPHEYHVYPGTHEIAYWKEHVEEYLSWYIKGWE